MTNLSEKRAFSMDSGDVQSKSVDIHVENVVDKDKEAVSNFTERGFVNVENWSLDGGEARSMLSKRKLGCSSLAIEKCEKSSNLDSPNEVCDAFVSASRTDVAMNSVVVEVGDASRDSGELTDANVYQNYCKVNVSADLPTLGESRSLEFSNLVQPEGGSKSFGLERCTALKGDSSSNTGAECDIIKACGCSFCLKASYILSDLHYQDVKGRMAALKKSQKEANILVQRSKVNSNESSRLEFDLTDQWKSLFVHMEDKFVTEGNLLVREVDRRIAFGQLKRFSWRELQLATDSFSEKNVLGQGGFGKVYKGVLSDNTKVAVKRLTDYESPGGDAAFQREVEMISVAVHRNLLRLIGFCTTPTERLLVYPFMQNLSVAYRLREIKPGEAVLDWPTRKRVAVGTARGLEYLHEHCNPKIIHRDVKAANVLLDEDFEAVVGDFGLAKLVDVRKTNVTTQVRGTMGHIAPEYLSTGKSSERTDVFGYGVMLLEIVTGQRAIDFSRLEEEDDVLLLDHVKKLEREQRLDAIVDRNLNKNYTIQEVEMMIKVSLLCTQSSPEDRPAMSEVVRMLEGEGLAERWEEWQHVEVTRRQEYDRLQRRFDWGEDSVYNQDAIELSGGR